ncbi:MAG: DUF2207 domain-containing protein [Sphaerochaetaceae bacterium]
MKKKLWLSVFLLLTPFLIAAADYSILAMKSDIVVSQTGIYDINETIEMEFHRPLHGFYRTIPADYGQQGIRARITKIQASAPFELFRGNSYEIRIGDANKTVSGIVQYELRYRYDIGGDRHPDYDEFYFNLVGEDWQEPIQQFSFSITFPFALDAQKIWFTKGVWGSTSDQGISWSLDSTQTVISGTAKAIAPSEALTVRVEMPEGYYAKRPDYTRKAQIPFALVVALFMGIAWMLWWRYGKDEDLIVVPQFFPPQGMSPLDVGYIIDGSVDPSDVTAMIFYWADKGNLTIVEDKKKFTFIRGLEPQDAPPYEKKVFRQFFACGDNGVVTNKQLEGTFFSSYQKLKRDVERYYSKGRSLLSTKASNMASLAAFLLVFVCAAFGYVATANYPGGETVVASLVALGCSAAFLAVFKVMQKRWHVLKTVKKGAFFIAIFLLLGITFFLLYAMSKTLFVALIGLVGIVSIAFLATVTVKRSAYGQQKIEEVLGLRMYIQTVELEHLKMMINDDPAYYYHILSFAIVLGLEETWAKKFSSLVMESPSWYSGPTPMVDALILSSMLRRCNSSLLSSVKLPPRSTTAPRFGGSSFGGGGFSGGGFGGGGGGAW